VHSLRSLSHKSAPLFGLVILALDETMNRIFFTIIIASLISSCASTDKKRNETLAAISTVSAIAVAVPLVPFAEVYHIINDTKGKDKEGI